MNDSKQDIRRDVETVARIEMVPTLLRIVCDVTGMGFGAVARVTDGSWTACAVEDRINFNLMPGGQLDIETTLCKEVRESRTPIVIDHASADPIYCTHHTPKTYAIESYISVPIVLPDGSYFGNLCAIDPRPAKVSDVRTTSMFVSFAQLIGHQLEIERNRERERAALLEARSANELREQFMAILGHDLRNPLSAILFSTKLLQVQARDQTNIRQTAARIDRSAKRMTDLISEILDLARARLTGGIGVEPALIDDLSAPLLEVIAELQEVNPERRIETRIRGADRVWCDPGRIQQLVSNLVGNALAYGAPSEPVSLDVSKEGDVLVLSVANQGEPIPADDLPRLLQPFWRGSGAEDKVGLGLGLYICDQIVKAHGGELSISSTREAGTTVTTRIPQPAA